MSYNNSAYFNGATGTNYFAGKVGIGITTPKYTLHSVAYNNTSLAASLLWGQYYGASIATGSISPSHYTLHVVSNANPDGTSGTGGYKSLLLVRADGNVGIGTSTPQAKLAVNGDIFAKKIKVIQTGWPDYVFKPGYQLPSLQDVGKYIKNHHHLPGIPSAAEVEKESLDLGDMNKRLLQKVEELTLYLIDQQKQINQLKQQNEILSERYSKNK